MRTWRRGGCLLLRGSGLHGGRADCASGSPRASRAARLSQPTIRIPPRPGPPHAPLTDIDIDKDRDCDNDDDNDYDYDYDMRP